MGMLVAKLPNRDIGIAFQHQSWPVVMRFEKDESGQPLKVVHRRTSCSLFELKDDHSMISLGYGWALCSRNDNFSKETGRKLALARVLKKMTPRLGRKEREIVWLTYLARPRNIVSKPPAPKVEIEVVTIH
jgi:hypothetical protein